MNLPSFFKRNGPPKSDENQNNRTAEKLSRVKETMKMAFNNLKYGWTIQPDVTFKRDAPIWLLGRLYHNIRSGQEPSATRWLEVAEEPAEFNDLRDFLADFASRLWFTYRSGFEALPPSSIQSDAGWGCMLRSGQMFLAAGLVLHKLNRDWNMFAIQERSEMEMHRRIVSWFADCPEAPFSIHNMVEMGKAMGKQSGDWFGPSSTAQIIKRLVNKASITKPFSADLSDVAIYVALDQTIALDELEELCNRSTHTPSRTDNNSIENIEKICGTPVSFEHWNHFETEVPRTRSVQSDTYDIDKSFIEDSGINSPSTSKMTRQHSDFESWAVVDSDANEVEFRHSTPVRHSISQRASIKPEIGIGQINYVRPPSRKLSDLKVVPSSGWQKSLIIMIPLRLGGETMNPIYVESLKTLFSLDYFIGIMGGKQKRSVYFVGWHGDDLIYLDPHFCQDADVGGSLKSYHCMHPRMLPFSKMDPSCTIGFYIKDRVSLEQFCKDVRPVADEGNTKAHMFSIVKSKEAYIGEQRKESREAPNSFVFL